MTGLVNKLFKGGVILGLFCVALALTARATGLIFNVTRSAPRGIYKSIPAPPLGAKVQNVAQMAVRFEMNTYVFFCPDQRWPGFHNNPNYRVGWSGNCPDGYEALIKPVAAWPGDMVTIAPLGVAVNGTFIHNSMPLKRDANGKDLHHYAFGNYRVPEGQIWVVSSYSTKSFDSRYYGPIPISAIKAWASPFIVESREG